MCGEKGTQGIKGDKGDRGDKGEKGDKGDKGERGDKGDKGVPGPIGANGPTGPKGTDGPEGLRGPKGDIGPEGPEGPTGSKGDKGDTGPEGSTGNTGPKGKSFVWRNTWTVGVNYVPDDVVYYNGSSYICINPTNGNPSTSPNDWSLMCLKGPQGPTGPTGPAGSSTILIFSTSESVSNSDYIGCGSSSSNNLRNTILIPANYTINLFCFNIREIQAQGGAYTATLYINGNPSILIATINDSSTQISVAVSSSLQLNQFDLLSIRLSSPNGALNNGACASIIVSPS
jgi:hypothetical protein